MTGQAGVSDARSPVDDRENDRRELRDNGFDLLRLLFAVFVVYSHSFPILLGEARRDPLGRLTNGQMDLGALAVNGFFLISGFLITMSWSRSHGLADFFTRRALRIYPGYIACSLFCVLVIAPLAAADATRYWAALHPTSVAARALLLKLPPQPVPLFGDMPNEYLNGSLWTIPYEFRCYALLAVLGLTGLLRRPRIVLAMALASLIFFAASCGPEALNPVLYLRRWEHYHVASRVLGDFSHWPRFLALFLCGAAYFLYRERLHWSRRGLILALLGLVLCALVFAPWNGIGIAFPVLGGYALFYLALRPANRLTRTVMQDGDFSYGIYLYAWPVQQLVLMHVLAPTIERWSEGPPLLTRWVLPHALFLLSIILIVPIAALSWRFIEQPCLRTKSWMLAWQAARARRTSVTG